jgi:hypothetical protein
LLRLEAGEGGGFGVEGGDSFDKAGNGEGIADAAMAADEVEPAAFASERDGDADERRDTGTIDLGDAVEVDDDLARALFHHRVSLVIEMIAGVADGEAAVDSDKMDAAGFADGNFQWWMLSHSKSLKQFAKK